jgi:hypothetical protein
MFAEIAEKFLSTVDDGTLLFYLRNKEKMKNRNSVYIFEMQWRQLTTKL